ncbi:hypothetical protein [Limnofasciculus baicalensis]|uniref:Uncharacterized protein n=1 Tax=Limnofasciculus baicalensis BBK-W-15 TaxID=2699891 RepID=A0AAE3KLL4_9CYAN|nr:hypothetical protein [Limnofasciculus baicalensis]MCP2727816.1 hypothetical protein [Limnofasciculus baicalensis BBK-W-15]
MPIIDLLLVITLIVLGVVLLRGVPKNPQQNLENAFTKQQLDDAFYRLLEEQSSCISLIQLTAASRVDVEDARKYLDRQVKMFAAIPEVDPDGDTFYRFPKLHGRILEKG